MEKENNRKRALMLQWTAGRIKDVAHHINKLVEDIEFIAFNIAIDMGSNDNAEKRVLEKLKNFNEWHALELVELQKTIESSSDD